jgi:hypothetical protein
MIQYKAVTSGNTYMGEYKPLHCLLGSCVGVLIYNENTIGLTHGLTPSQVYTQISNITRNLDDTFRVILLGGMKGSIGDANSISGKKALKGIRYEDRSGEAGVITVSDKNEIKIRKIKER